MKYTPIVFLHNIKKENGGLHRAIYQRVNAFSEYCDRVIIFTYGFDSEFWDLCNYHRSNGNINENVEIYNIYDGEFSDNNSNVFYYEKNKKYYYFQNTSDTYRVFNEVGQYIYYLVLNKYGIPKFKDHFVSPWNRYMKEVHDSQGYVRKKIFMDKNNIPAYEICYSKKNNPITSSVLTENGKKRKNFFWFPGQREFENEVQMGVDCLYDFIQDIDNPLLFIDKREHVKYFEKINAQHIRKVFVLHSNHLDFPYTEPSKFSPTVSDLFYSLDNQTIDRLVVLTTGQKEDILLEKNLKNKIEVIPHYQPQILNDIVTKKENLIVSLARYHNAKNLADAIKIVNKVKDVIPTIRYEIYGYGPQKDMLNSLIKNLGLEENVFLKGHTTSPISKLEEAKVSLMTSNYEGFCLTISEALACATPVVSYKTKYGPNELIRNGLDGYLVDLNENKIINAADKLIEILKMNSISYTKMQRNALEITKRFSKDKTASLWENFINKLD